MPLSCWHGNLTVPAAAADIRQLRRLNYRLTEKCEADIDELCSDACSFFTGQACGGRVLRCLTNKQDQVKNKVQLQ